MPPVYFQTRQIDFCLFFSGFRAKLQRDRLISGVTLDDSPLGCKARHKTTVAVLSPKNFDIKKKFL